MSTTLMSFKDKEIHWKWFNLVRSATSRPDTFSRLHLEEIRLRGRLPQQRVWRSARRRLSGCRHLEVAHGPDGGLFPFLLEDELLKVAFHFRAGHRALILSAFWLELLQSHFLLLIVLRNMHYYLKFGCSSYDFLTTKVNTDCLLNALALFDFKWC